MAARWGEGEEILPTCNMELFSTNALDEGGMLQGVLSSEHVQDLSLESSDTLESLADCLDPSILSIFEDPAVDTKSRLDEESEATLLTALTEILDNVDDENLSPFDTLPDAEFLSGQKVREQSPLRRLLNLPMSPSDREPVCIFKSVTSSAGKVEGFGSERQWKTTEESPQWKPSNSPRGPMDVATQRSDGEEEDSGLGDAPLSLASFDWGVPLSLEQEGDYVSVSLCDLVKSMHPYCVPVCLEQAEEGGEQVLPEGGILLEVVDQGEQGEPILRIPGLSLPLALAEEGAAESEQRVPEEEWDPSKATGKDAPAEPDHPHDSTPATEGSDEKAITERPKEEASQKRPSRRKKKRKDEEGGRGEGRVLRSATLNKPTEPLPEKPLETGSQSSKKKKRVTFALPVTSAQTETPSKVQPETQTEQPETQQIHEPESAVPKPSMELAGKTAQSNSQLTESNCQSKELASEQPLGTKAEADGKQATVYEETSDSKQNESKPKPLSLQQYRLLRQKKKPAPKEKEEDHSSRWPTLPEPPKELPPIPCLLEQNPRDPRRAPVPQATRTMPDVTPAWQPVGTCAPPVPEALLVPLGSALASSKTPTPRPKLSPAQTSSTLTTPETLLNQPTSQKELTPGPQVCQTPPSGPARNSLPAAKSEHTIKATSLQSTTRQVVSQEPGVLGAREQPPQGPIPTVGQSVGAALQVPTLEARPSLTTEPHCPSAPVTETTTETAKQQPQPDPAVQKMAVPPADPPISTDNTTAASRPQPSAALPSLPTQARTISPQHPTKKNLTPVQEPPAAKEDSTVDLIQAFTSEIGIEAADLASLLEQFEETQAKEEQRVPEVCGRAAAVGSSGSELQSDRKSLEHVRMLDLGSTAELTPPATPPHQIWKPLAPVALLGNPKGLKQSLPKAIQMEPRPLSVSTAGSRPAKPGAPAQPAVSTDHDYCLPVKESSVSELGRRWNVKWQPSITIKAIGRPSPTATPAKNQPLDHRTQPGAGAPVSSVLLSPESSPSRPEAGTAGPEEKRHENVSTFSCSKRAASPPSRGRGRGRADTHYRVRSPSSDSNSSASSSRSRSRSQSQSRSRSHSRSQSRSPPRKRFRSRRSESSSSSGSSSSSRSPPRSPPRRRRYSYSSSRSGSWSRSRSRSPQGRAPHWWGSSRHSPNHRQGYRHDSRDRFQHDDTKTRKEKAIEERRVVYVGRIRGGMTRKELKERFSLYGEIEDCTLHFRDHGDNYGFVTYYNTNDAFAAIENGSKLRQPDELPFDLCFGGRRQFCKTSYADLDSNREFDPLPARGKFDALDFDTLLKQAQKGLRR
ncbi:peroxisome proliferator-activated receptor gamma coactivator-related protein 1 [Megalops cyprinoides]|uniref:peroxisome proliferator-activated receptor gamma coactivator-related protein 1 n=1 Tax=Megalops cyprinoides TaxID=118141 RepID=UPI0018655621|nr:peroxisome proliferator-activated receptor gamma coactivator-related protein 1 [Megalops cyprinoides]